MFDNASIVWSANQLTTMILNGKIVFDNPIQRGLVWEKARKSLLIHSMATGIPIPATYARRSVITNEEGKEVKVYDVLDGRQRLTSIAAYFNNEYALTDLPLVVYEDLDGTSKMVNISGLYYNQLPEGLQERIKNARISVIYFDDLDDDEVKELFKRLNNGKSLSTKARVLASCTDLDYIMELGNHDLFKDMLTEKSFNDKNYVSTIMKCYRMMTELVDGITFTSKEFNPYIENTVISPDDGKKLSIIFDMILNTHTALINRDEKAVAKKLYKETHMVSMIPIFIDAIEKDFDEERVADFVMQFFGTTDGTSISEKYNNSCAGGNAKNVAIVTRHSELINNWNLFVQSV